MTTTIESEVVRHGDSRPAVRCSSWWWHGRPSLAAAAAAGGRWADAPCRVCWRSVRACVRLCASA
eukprot:4581147-Pleurochrysis_carterae.AAC.1